MVPWSLVGAAGSYEKFIGAHSVVTQNSTISIYLGFFLFECKLLLHFCFRDTVSIEDAM
jgi:hypothetical protein